MEGAEIPSSEAGAGEGWAGAAISGAVRIPTHGRQKDPEELSWFKQPGSAREGRSLP